MSDHVHISAPARSVVRAVLVLLALVLAFVVLVGPPHGWDPLKLVAGAVLALGVAVFA